MKNSLNLLRYIKSEAWAGSDVGSQVNIQPYFIPNTLPVKRPVGTRYDLVMATVNGNMTQGKSMNIYKNSTALYEHDATDAGASLSMMFGTGSAQEGQTSTGVFTSTGSTTADEYSVGGGCQNISVSNTIASWQSNVEDQSPADSSKQFQSMLSVLSLTVGGGLLQAPVVTTTDIAQTSSLTEAAWADSALTCTITPTSATSKLLIVGTIGLSSSGSRLRYKLDRDASDILVGDAEGSRTRVTSSVDNTGNMLTPLPIFYIVDSGSTSATTIKVEIGHASGSATNLYVNRVDAGLSNIRFKAGVSQLAVYEIEGI